MLVGEISEITRYPVKSFAGETLDACRVDTYGLFGDRFCAFYDETKEGWNRFITARDIPKMRGYTARLLNNEISVTSPNGEIFSWNEELLKEIQRYTNRKVSKADYKAPNPEDPKLMSVDLASILIITDSSLRRLESIWGKKLDKRRFRANIILSLNENNFDETDWIGKQLSFGDVKLKVESSCERCSIITLDPDTLERDVTLLKKVNEQMNLCFGLYASVIKPGQICTGQKVYLIE
ncbi:MOSC domain-containing protein [Paenibacillus sp. MAH-36]|uniref:MOSC domain-containing protein n=1 Tax=Paenibacillus violae TaxID=3077234 RepID=A0ABU3R9X4_9BACL|nr:MOSC domain-containing protein [Paenibacillus sp. PFR10]MDU0200881.1 MOSC domain-containing protein [Paenibacillus sp. PFR10]